MWCKVLNLWVYVVQSVKSLGICGAKCCLFGYMWCKVLNLWVYVVQSVASLDICGAKC